MNFDRNTIIGFIVLAVLFVGYFFYTTKEQQAYQQALITRVQAQANRFTDTAALFQALGGGWWNRRDDTVQTIGAPTRCCP